MRIFSNKYITTFIASAIIVITAITAVQWNIYTPVMSDDLCYMRKPPQGPDASGEFWTCCGEMIETFGDAVDASIIHFSIINGRLANILHYLLQTISMHNNIENILCGLAIAAMLVLIAMTARQPARPDMWTIVMSTVLMWTALPWYDGMQSSDYQINYIWTSVLICCTVIMCCRLNSLGKAAYAGTLVLTFVTGMMHEGFTAVLIIYFVARLLFNRDVSTKRTAAVIAVLVLAFAIQLTGGILSRAKEQPGVFEVQQIYFSLSRITFSLWPLALAALAVFVDYKTLNTSAKELVKRHAALFTAACAGAVMPILLMLFDRVFWPMDLFCILIIIDVASRLANRIKPATSVITCTFFTFGYILWCGQLLHAEKRFADEFAETQRLAGDIYSPKRPFSSILAIDAMPSDSVPWYLFDIPGQPLEIHGNTARLGSTFGSKADYVMPASPQYAFKPTDQWPRIPGNNNLRGKWPFIIADSKADCHYIVTFGAPDSNMPPFDRLLSHLTGRSREAEHKIVWWPLPLINHHGDSLRQVYIYRLPRTLRHRPVLRIDSITSNETNAPA